MSHQLRAIARHTANHRHGAGQYHQGIDKQDGREAPTNGQLDINTSQRAFPPHPLLLDQKSGDFPIEFLHQLLALATRHDRARGTFLPHLLQRNRLILDGDPFPRNRADLVSDFLLGGVVGDHFTQFLQT